MKTLTESAGASSSGPVIHFPTDAEERQLVADTLRRLHKHRQEQSEAAIVARPALARLVDVMKHRTGQGYKLRRLLFSMWSGTPGADLSDLVCFDWTIRQDLCLVFLGWGYEDATTKFFYRSLEAALADAGLMDWFREEGNNEIRGAR